MGNAITDANAKRRDHLYFAFMSWQRSVRDARYKLIEYCVENERHTQLFDLKTDPDELKNLAEDPTYKEQLLSLRKRLEADRVRLNDSNTPHTFANDLGKYFWSRYEADQKTKN